jgi:Rrf2 family protein
LIVFKVSEAASLALHAMTVLATNPGRAISTSEIAEGLGVSENHLSKVFQRLARAGLVRSTRGPKGGFSLDRAADDLTLLDVYEAIEGPLVPRSCLFGRPVCNGQCILGDLLHSVNTQIHDRLATTKLSSLPELEGVLTNG